MEDWYNSSDKPLSSQDWLEFHHKAKLKERTEFAKKIINKKYRTIVDLGCGPCLWLHLFKKYAHPECKLIGIDVDESSFKGLDEVISKDKKNVSILNYDFEKETHKIPKADLILAFNIFSYIKNP